MKKCRRERPGANPKKGRGTRAKKVLIVEDDLNIADLLRLYLEKDGYEVYLAADGGKGVERLRQVQPDLVLKFLFLQ